MSILPSSYLRYTEWYPSWYEASYPLTLGHIGQYLATRGDQDVVGVMVDPSGCLLARTLNWLYPDASGISHWKVGGGGYVRETISGRCTDSFPFTPELRQLVQIFDHVRDVREGLLVTKAQLHEHLVFLGASRLLDTLFPAPAPERRVTMMEDAYYRDWMTWKHHWYDNELIAHFSPTSIDWTVNAPTFAEPAPELSSIASVLEEAETQMGTMTEKKKAMESVKEQIAELELALV